MKVTKGQLKSLLKECIKELLEEGAFNNALEEVLTEAAQGGQQAPLSAFQVMNPPQQQQAPATPDMSMGSFQNPHERLRALTQATAAAAGGSSNPQQRAILENIFADTAATTLREQAMDPGARGTGGLSGLLGEMPVSQQQAQADRDQLQALSFGGDITRWAQAAFAGKKKA